MAIWQDVCNKILFYTSRCFENDTLTDLEPEVTMRFISMLPLKFKNFSLAVDNYEGSIVHAEHIRSGFTRKWIYFPKKKNFWGLSLMLTWVVAFCEAINKVSAKIKSQTRVIFFRKFNAWFSKRLNDWVKLMSSTTGVFRVNCLWKISNIHPFTVNK